MVSGYFENVKIKFFNSCNYFTGTLASNAAAFGIGIEKEVFPYSYYNQRTYKNEYETPENFCAGLNEEDAAHVVSVCNLKGWVSHKNFMNIPGHKNLLNISEYRKYYNDLDCEILFKILVKFYSVIIETTSVDITDRYTIGSATLHIYKELGSFIGTHALVGDHSEYIRSQLSGGRVAIRDNKPQIFEKKVLVPLDINSLYPASNNGLLLGKPKIITTETMADLMTKTDFFVRVNILRVPKSLSIPWINEKDPKTGLRCYSNKPVGNHLICKDMVITYMEYHKMEYSDFEIIDGEYYDEGLNMNSVFLTEILYALRQTMQGAAKLIIKLILNNFWGKLCQREYDDVVKIVSSTEEIQKLYMKNQLGIMSWEPVANTVVRNSDGFAVLDENNYIIAKWKVKCSNDSVKKYISYSHESFRVLARSKLFGAEYQFALEEAGFNLLYGDTDSFHVVAPTVEEYTRMMELACSIYQKETKKSFDPKRLGGAKNDFEPTLLPGETFTEGTLKYADRGVYTAPKQYYEEVNYRVDTETEKNILKKVPHVRCKGIKANAIIIKSVHNMESDNKICAELNIEPSSEHKSGTKCDAIFAFYRKKYYLLDGMFDSDKDAENVAEHLKEYFTVDSCKDGKGFSVAYKYSIPVARNHFKRKF